MVALGETCMKVFLIVLLIVAVLFLNAGSSRNRPKNMTPIGPPEGIRYSNDPMLGGLISEGLLFGGGPYNDITGGDSTANLVLTKGDDILIGQLSKHGNKLQLPSGFRQGDEDMELTALRGASAMTGWDLEAAYYGKGIANTNLFKDTPETKRANVIIRLPKNAKIDYNKHEQNEELDPTFSKDSSRTKWVPIKELLNNSTVPSDSGACVDVPFYIKRGLKEVMESK
uniref:Nudix hydrolase domain-containing protein n=1 Tax=viral metagenome TaxID=1070528 RepID=A0A6C0LK61_9ZZZZ